MAIASSVLIREAETGGRVGGDRERLSLPFPLLLLRLRSVTCLCWSRPRPLPCAGAQQSQLYLVLPPLPGFGSIAGVCSAAGLSGTAGAGVDKSGLGCLSTPGGETSKDTGGPLKYYSRSKGCKYLQCSVAAPLERCPENDGDPGDRALPSSHVTV